MCNIHHDVWLPQTKQMHYESWKCNESTSKAQVKVLQNLLVRRRCRLFWQEASSDQVVGDSIAAAKSALGLTRLESVPVVHCRNAYGIVLESAAGWKFAFSGDTRPCPQMAAAAKDSTILVHEVIPVSFFQARFPLLPHPRRMRHYRSARQIYTIMIIVAISPCDRCSTSWMNR